MLKSQLLDALNQKLPDLSGKDIALALNCIIKQMENSLVQGERIEIRDFGSFQLKRRRPRLARNPKTGESFAVNTRTAVHFKPGKAMRERVNQARA